jgi:hypothetical protein
MDLSPSSCPAYILGCWCMFGQCSTQKKERRGSTRPTSNAYPAPAIFSANFVLLEWMPIPAPASLGVPVSLPILVVLGYTNCRLQGSRPVSYPWGSSMPVGRLYEATRFNKLTQVRRSTCLRPGYLLILGSKHIDLHTKLNICPEPGCSYRAAKIRDLRRHTLTHGLVDGAIVYYCPAAGCQHNEGGIYISRLDNAKRHIRMRHAGLTLTLISRVYRK